MRIYELKRTILEFKKNFWPLREMINKLQRYQPSLISEKLVIYFRDIYDHIFRMSDSLENFRDLIFGMIEMYQSNLSNKMNDIMKTLTIISTLFIHLSFLAGFYGMNFVYMPELGFRYSYPILIGVMLIIIGGMIYYFKKKKWI